MSNLNVGTDIHHLPDYNRLLGGGLLRKDVLVSSDGLILLLSPFLVSV